MEQKSQDPEPSTLRAKLAGAVFALTVVIPAMYLPGFLDRSQQERLPVSLWIALPSLGTVFCTQLLAGKKNRLWAGFFGFLGGCSCYLAASSWASGSPHTSRLEVMMATLLGGLPVLFLYKFWKKMRNPIADNSSTRDAKVYWLNWLDAQRNTQKKFSPTQLILVIAAFSALTVLTISDLNQLERHGSPSRFAWSPALSVYDRYGYWPAALFTPCLGLVLICWSAWIKHHKPRK